MSSSQRRRHTLFPFLPFFYGPFYLCCLLCTFTVYVASPLFQTTRFGWQSHVTLSVFSHLFDFLFEFFPHAEIWQSKRMLILCCFYSVILPGSPRLLQTDGLVILFMSVYLITDSNILQPMAERCRRPTKDLQALSCRRGVTLSSKRPDRLGAKKTERRHVPWDLNLSRRKRIGNGKKRKKFKSTPKSKRKRTIWKENKDIERKNCASLIIAAFASLAVCVSSIFQTRTVQPHISVTDRTRNSCFLYSRLATTHLSNTTQFCFESSLVWIWQMRSPFCSSLLSDRQFLIFVDWNI